MSSAFSLRNRGLVRSGADREKILLRTNVVLLVALLMLIFIIPVVPLKDNILTRVLLVIVVVSGLFAADFSKKAFRNLMAIGSLVIIVTLVDLFFTDSPVLTSLTFLLNTIFFIMVTIALVAHVARAKEVYGSTLLCAINSYLLIGLTLSILFIIIYLNQPGSFSNIEAGSNIFSEFVYFGFVTLTTLGYGDITPATPVARSLSTFTALFGQLYLVIIMAIIIGKFLIVKNQSNQP
jgi:voltage-gated potassium channel